MATTEVITDKLGHKSSKGKPEHVVDEFDSGKTVRCADRTIWKYDAKAKLWRRQYTIKFDEYLRYQGGVKKPKRNLPDEVYERTDEHKAAIADNDAARRRFFDAEDERREALAKLRRSNSSPAKVARIETALREKLEEARAEFQAAILAQAEHARLRKIRIRQAEEQRMAEAMERNRQRQERSQATQRDELVADLRELLGSK